jgi:hypothetical protein
MFADIFNTTMPVVPEDFDDQIESHEQSPKKKIKPCYFVASVPPAVRSKVTRNPP